MMGRRSIGGSLRLALLGLTVALGAITALGVAGLAGARQDYENEITRAHELETAAANLLAAGVIEESVLRRGPAPGLAADRERAAAAFGAAAREALRRSGGDPRSARLIVEYVTVQAEARDLAASARATPARGRADPVAARLHAGRRLSAALAARQRERRAAARDRVTREQRRALLTALSAGGLALLAALVLVADLIRRMRRPLSELAQATKRLAAGELDLRVAAGGPTELADLGEAFNAMAADLQAAHASLDEERRRLGVTIASLGDGLIVCDAAGDVVAANPRAAVLVPELRPGEAGGTGSGPLPTLERALADEVVVSHLGRTLAVTAARMTPEAGAGVVWTVRDVSERARLERLKTEFVATASHELRSPLTSAKGFLELLMRSDRLGPRDREFAELALRSAIRLAELVDDLLDVARIEAGHGDVRPEPTDVAALAREVAALMRARIEARTQRLELDLEPGGAHALADPRRMRQVLTNLLTNAHLYTDSGGELTVRVRPDEGWVRIEVSDTGRGMTREQIEHIFERFYRADDYGRGEPGTGLGLAIVKSLVDLQGGTIEVESAPGSGTTFAVRLPAANAAAASHGDARAALPGARVLVVDDEPAIARLIAAHLQESGVVTVAVHTGQAALQRLRDERFDAVSLDLLMPGTSGFEVLRRLREDEALRGIPIVLTSALAGDGALPGAWAVSKPFDADELLDALGAAVLRGRSRVLVVGRSATRDALAPELDRHGLAHEWVTSGAEAARRCAERRFEVALVDAGVRSPRAVLRSLALRGRRGDRGVLVFSDDRDAPGLARLGPDAVAPEHAADALLDALAGRDEGYDPSGEA